MVVVVVCVCPRARALGAVTCAVVVAVMWLAEEVQLMRNISCHVVQCFIESLFFITRQLSAQKRFSISLPVDGKCLSGPT